MRPGNKLERKNSATSAGGRSATGMKNGQGQGSSTRRMNPPNPKRVRAKVATRRVPKRVAGNVR